jgi:hypothetical protein
MRATARTVITAALAGLAVLVFVLAATSTPSGRAVDVYLLYVGGVVLLTLVAATSSVAGSEFRSEFDAALHAPPARPERPRELARLEREVYLAESSAFYLHYRLRPTLRVIAAQRLRDTRGIDLDGQPDAARDALGEPAWELLHAERPAPRRDARGTPIDRLREVVDGVERI